MGHAMDFSFEKNVIVGSPCCSSNLYTSLAATVYVFRDANLLQLDIRGNVVADKDEFSEIA
jgi:hypothetical protein